MSVIAKEDAERLINAVFPLAETMLKRYGEFYPYGGYMTLDGKIIDIGAQVRREKQPKSKDLLAVLHKSLKDVSRTHHCKVAAIVTNVTVTIPGSSKKSDAIQVSVEHKEGYSADVFYPYNISTGKIIYGDAFAQPGSHPIFVRN